MTMPPDSNGAETWALTVAGDCDAQRSCLHPEHIPMPFDEFSSVTVLTGACGRLNRCKGGIHMALDRPVHAPKAADGTTPPAVALHVAPGTAVHDGLAQMFTPPRFWG